MKFVVAAAAVLLAGTQSVAAPTFYPTEYPPTDFPTSIYPTVSPPTVRPTKASKSPAAKSSKAVGFSIASAQLASNQQANKSFLSFLIAGTMIVAAAALLNVAWKWAAQKWRQPRSVNDLEEEEEAVDVDGFEDDFEDEPKHYSSDVIVGEGEGNVEIVETH